MIVSTTPSMEGKSVREYHGIVIGHGTTKQYKPEKAQEAVRVAIGQMKKQARDLGANAVVGVHLQWEYPGRIHVSGTAVTVWAKEHGEQREP